MTEILDRCPSREFIPVVGDAVPYYYGSKMCENTFTCLECGEKLFFKDVKQTAGKRKHEKKCKSYEEKSCQQYDLTN